MWKTNFKLNCFVLKQRRYGHLIQKKKTEKSKNITHFIHLIMQKHITVCENAVI